MTSSILNKYNEPEFDRDTENKKIPSLGNLGTSKPSNSLCDSGAFDRARMANILKEFNESITESENQADSRSWSRNLPISGRITSQERSLNDEQDPESLKSEIDSLRQTVYRLNIQLSQSLQNNSFGLRGTTISLPGEGPIPQWLICSSILCPLLAAYDERIMEKEELVNQAEEGMRQFEIKWTEIVHENDRLHAALQGAELNGGPGDETDWAYFIEQAKIVLKENTILSEQLEVQQEKYNYMSRCHEEEVSSFTHQLSALVKEKKELETELLLARQRYSRICLQTDELMESKSAIGASNDQLDKLKRSLQNISDHHDSGVGELTDKLKYAYEEEKKLRENLAEAEISKRKLQDEVNGLEKALRECQKKNGLMKSVLKREITVEEYLNDVISKATEISHQRDEYAIAIKHKENEFMKSLEHIFLEINSLQAIPEINEPENSEPITRLEIAIRSLVHENIRLKNQCKEQDQQIRYLSAILREKEENVNLIRLEKRNLEDKLGIVLKSALDDRE